MTLLMLTIVMGCARAPATSAAVPEETVPEAVECATDAQCTLICVDESCCGAPCEPCQTAVLRTQVAATHAEAELECSNEDVDCGEPSSCEPVEHALVPTCVVGSCAFERVDAANTTLRRLVIRHTKSEESKDSHETTTVLTVEASGAFKYQQTPSGAHSHRRKSTSITGSVDSMARRQMAVAAMGAASQERGSWPGLSGPGSTESFSFTLTTDASTVSWSGSGAVRDMGSSTKLPFASSDAYETATDTMSAVYNVLRTVDPDAFAAK